MAKPLFFLLFLFHLLLLSATTTTVNTLAPTPAPYRIPTRILLPPPLPSQPQSPKLTYQQLNNIIDALIGSGDFNSWANILSFSDPSFFPLSATLFIPNDAALPPATTPFDPYIFPYHIVPQRLTFSDLLLFKPFSRLPTLLPFKSILITNNSISNFTLDGILLSHPDLYVSASSVAVHGIDSFFNYTVYGSNGFEVVAPPSPPLPPPPPLQGMFVPAGEVVFPLRGSDGSCLCTEVSVVFLLGIFWFLRLVKNHRSGLGF